MKHVHNATCPKDCSRLVDLDPHSATDSYSLVTRRLVRSDEKPRWWPFAMMAWRRLCDFGILLLAALVLKYCHVAVGGP
jgi:hypothetical protein